MGAIQNCIGRKDFLGYLLVAENGVALACLNRRFAGGRKKRSVKKIACGVSVSFKKLCGNRRENVRKIALRNVRRIRTNQNGICTEKVNDKACFVKIFDIFGNCGKFFGRKGNPFGFKKSLGRSILCNSLYFFVQNSLVCRVFVNDV